MCDGFIATILEEKTFPFHVTKKFVEPPDRGISVGHASNEHNSWSNFLGQLDAIQEMLEFEIAAGIAQRSKTQSSEYLRSR